MNLAAVISFYCGGPGSGCHGENCGRPKVLEDMLKQHDAIANSPRRFSLESDYSARKESALKWQAKALQGLMDNLTDRVIHPEARKYIRMANSYMEKAERDMAKEWFQSAMINQEEVLMALHEVIRIGERYPSSVRQVAHA